MKNLFRIKNDDDRPVVERKLGHGLELFGMDSDAAGPFLMAMLGFNEKSNALRGLDAKIIGERTREALIGLLRNRSRLTPAVLIIEDLHWIDPASEKLLGQIVREKEQMPLLILCTARPSFTSPWTQMANIRELRLEPLSPESTVNMVRSILDCDTIEESLSRVIIEETGCNPLYTEEITRYLLESGSIKRTGRTAACELSAGEIKVPSTILDLLQTRVDRLDEEPKELLQTAAVIGQRFSTELARRVSGLGDSFDRHLCELEKLGLIFREQIEDQVVYRFKHALLQDAVYNSLLQERREGLHQLVGETMEKLYSDRLNEWAHTLAYHWGNTRNTCKTVRYLAMAGEKSYWVCALEEAHQRFSRAVELIEAEPGCVDDLFLADVLVKWSRVFLYRADFWGLMVLLERYLPRMEALGDKRRLSLILTWLAQSHVFAGRGEKAGPLLERALAIAEETGDAECIGMAARELVWLYSYWIPDSRQSDTMVEIYYKQALECGEAVNDIIILMEVTTCMTIHALTRSRWPEAQRYYSKLVEIGLRFRDNRTLSHAAWLLGFAKMFEERYEEALENAEQSLQLSPDFLDELCAMAVKGGTLALSGKVHEGLEILRRVRQESIENEFILLRAGVDMPYGAAMVLAGHMEKGINHIHDAMKYWTSVGNYTQPVFGHLYLGDIYLRMATGTMKLPSGVILRNLLFILRTLPAAHRKACAHFEEVVRCAREYNMPGFLAKALYGLGVLSLAKKRVNEARSRFEEALKVAEASGLYIAEKIRPTLNSLENSKG